MKRKLLFTIWLCMSCMGLLACDRVPLPPDPRPLPIDLLGKDITDIKDRFAEIIPSDDFDDEIWNDRIDERWWVADSRGGWLLLHTVDDIIVEIHAGSHDFVTEAGIKVGDTFVDVLSAYPNAEWHITHLAANNGQLRFSFRFAGKRERMVVLGTRKFHIDDDLIQDKEVSHIIASILE